MNNKERGFYKDIIKSDILIAKNSIEHFISEERRGLAELEGSENKYNIYSSNNPIESKKALDNLEEVLYNVDEALSFLKRIGEE